jgi:hypothetical protein
MARKKVQRQIRSPLAKEDLYVWALCKTTRQYPRTMQLVRDRADADLMLEAQLERHGGRLRAMIIAFADTDELAFGGEQK